MEGVLTCYLDYGHSGVSFLSLNQVELKPVFSDNLISSVNTHPTDAQFHGINEAASCADACERRAPFKLLSFIASPPVCPPSPRNHISQTNLIYNMPFVNSAPCSDPIGDALFFTSKSG